MQNLYMYDRIIQDQINIPEQLLSKYLDLGLNETELVIILHIYRFHLRGNDLPSLEELSQFMTLEEQDIARCLSQLKKKGYLDIIRQNQGNLIDERYTLEPLFKAIYANNDKKIGEEDHIANLFILFEQEFGRILSPIEIETINQWLDEDGFQPAVIKAALREAVLMGKLNFRYIDRILNEWKKKGVQTVQDARKASKAFHTNSKEKTGKKHSRDTSVYYNWLEDDA
ncbi:DNA replication protein DnaD [Melghiribacillus thermohalophilus]|uniref:DNA replication protein DnaD n=1 Tax=Melghiribacillus thermohalophilus TaxID=1324956 RepID=A0A4R3N864_9BACI|nr:DnaD domain-containing protein [Melghiribacillus thermohalophilus]TCT25543.1 DNA replication protein DnaD [Melghiribacillus thermohalophilus]